MEMFSVTVLWLLLDKDYGFQVRSANQRTCYRHGYYFLFRYLCRADTYCLLKRGMFDNNNAHFLHMTAPLHPRHFVHIAVKAHHLSM